MRRRWLFFIFYAPCVLAFAGRGGDVDEMLLNGMWDFTPKGGSTVKIPVPEYWDARPGFDTDSADYHRRVLVPRVWKDKTILLRFEGINHLAEVYVNGQHAASHVGGWISFSIDVTSYVTAGETFDLTVKVKGGNHAPISDGHSHPLWPVGWFGHNSRWGIIHDVRLLAQGNVYIADAFIQTSWQKKTLEVAYDITNASGSDRTVQIHAEVVPRDMDSAVKSLQSDPLAIPAGQSRTVTLKSPWPDPKPWTPDSPHLYVLRSTLKDQQGGRDEDCRRFGFREVWIKGNRFMFNGHRLNLLGSSIVSHGEQHQHHRYRFITRETWAQTMTRLKALNIQVVRMHQQPAPDFVLDMADELGLMIIEESAIYARDYFDRNKKETYFQNCLKWIGPWIKDRRNHPSIVLWSAENEMGAAYIKWFSDEEMLKLGDQIRLYDRTRPIIYHGDEDVGDATINLHYPEGYDKSPKGDIYSWADKVSPAKPTGIGEFLTHYGSNGDVNQWWQGTWVRGLRYVGFADIRPYRLDWAWMTEQNTPKIINLRNSLAPVALFDKAYDQLGLDPVAYGRYPALESGQWVERTLVLYNDAFHGTDIRINVTVQSDDQTHASGTRQFSLPLGEHVDIPCSFQVPATQSKTLDLVLTTFKHDVLEFRETRRFNVTTGNEAILTSKEVRLNVQ